jgi:putative membrane protein (TIGR04086 family)
MKKFIKPLLYSLAMLFILTFIISLLNYINVISGLPLKIIKIIIPIISYFIAGFMIGKSCDKKGWLNGLEIGLILTVILVFINFLLKNKINILFVLYYLSLNIISVISSMIGINRKK